LIAASALALIEGLTVITNSVRIAQVLGHAPGHRTFLLGGAYHGDNGETAGPLVIDQIARFQADHAVLGVAAIDHSVGAMNADFDEAQVARAMLAHARQSIVLANAAKLGLKAAFRICAMDEIDVLICDQPPGRDYDTALRNPQLVLT
jgi:DeoR family glycerol-3-phosphate regulon repressor